MTWDGVVRLREVRLADLAARFGGVLTAPTSFVARAFVPIESASRNELTPLLTSSKLAEAERALSRGALLIADATLAETSGLRRHALLAHPFAAWAMAKVLTEFAEAPSQGQKPVLGVGVKLGPNVVLEDRVVLGDRVRVGAGTVIGSPGFGFVVGPGGDVIAVPQLAGVVIEDDVDIGALSTIDSGTLSPTRIERGAKLDAQVHVGHNVVVGAGTRVAAQSGIAGSVRIGRNVMIGGQVGITDHVEVGDGARIAAKSGVIGNVPAGAVYGGYPAMPHGRWLRGLAWLQRAAFRDSKAQRP